MTTHSMQQAMQEELYEQNDEQETELGNNTPPITHIVGRCKIVISILFIIMGIFLIAHTVTTIVFFANGVEEWNNDCGKNSGKCLVFIIFSSLFWLAMKFHQLYNKLPDCNYTLDGRAISEGGSAGGDKLFYLQVIKGLMIVASVIWSIIIVIGDAEECYSDVFYRLVMTYAIVLYLVGICVFSCGII